MKDFTEFQFGNDLSSDLGIIRVSDGDRYEEELFPEIEDVTGEVPGLIGQYYFGTNYKPKKITINIAFDFLTEEQLRRLRKVFSPGNTRNLIFGEQPYKRYMAKIETPIKLSYVCFDELERKPYSEFYPSGTELPDGILFDRTDPEHPVRKKIDPWVIDDSKKMRVYKGDGTIEFICYFPFAKQVFKYLPSSEEYENLEEWRLSSGILSYEDYSELDTYLTSTNKIYVYNPGDFPTGFRLYLPASVVTSNDINIIYKKTDTSGATPIANLNLKQMTLKQNDYGVLVDTNNGLITGVLSEEIITDGMSSYSYLTSGNLYNQYVKSGYFFKLETNEYGDFQNNLTIENGGSGDIKIFYDYLYF